MNSLSLLSYPEWKEIRFAAKQTTEVCNEFKKMREQSAKSTLVGSSERPYAAPPSFKKNGASSKHIQA